MLQAIDHSIAGSMTAQPPGIRPSALRVATHGRQVPSLVGGVLPLCRGAVSIFYNPSRQGVHCSWSVFLTASGVHTMLMCIGLCQSANTGVPICWESNREHRLSLLFQLCPPHLVHLTWMGTYYLSQKPSNCRFFGGVASRICSKHLVMVILLCAM